MEAEDLKNYQPHRLSNSKQRYIAIIGSGVLFLGSVFMIVFFSRSVRERQLLQQQAEEAPVKSTTCEAMFCPDIPDNVLPECPLIQATCGCCNVVPPIEIKWNKDQHADGYILLKNNNPLASIPKSLIPTNGGIYQDFDTECDVEYQYNVNPYVIKDDNEEDLIILDCKALPVTCSCDCPPEITPTPTPTIPTTTLSPTPTSTPRVTITPTISLTSPTPTPTSSPTPTTPVTPTPTLPGGGGGPGPGPGTDTTSWTYIFYVTADTDIYHSLNTAFNNIIGLQNNQTFINEMRARTNIIGLFSLSNSKRYKLVWGLNQTQPTMTSIEQNIDLSAPTTLSGLIREAKNDLPKTDYYYLNIANHGRGSVGLAFENNLNNYQSPIDCKVNPYPQGRCLSYQDLNLVWDQTTNVAENNRLDIVHFEVGTTALAEMAWQITGNNRFFIASQGNIWNQHTFADYVLLSQNTQTNPEELARSIAHKYYSIQLNIDAGKTISVINLPIFKNFFTQNFNSLPSYLIDLLNSGNKECIVNAHDSARVFIQDYVDLLAFIEKVLEFCPAPENVEDAQNIGRLRASLQTDNKLVMVSNHSNVNSHGLSIYLPQESNFAGYESYYLNNHIKFNNGFAWTEFLKEYLGTPEATDELAELPAVVGGETQNWASRMWNSVKQAFLSIFGR